MNAAGSSILDRIVVHKRAELERARVRRGFAQALTARPPAIIAELKKASPSKGVLIESYDPPTLAAAYQSGGAAALSVLTDGEFFRGRLEDLRAARQAVEIPVLRKDFTLEAEHVHEAAAWGADAILLIVAILPDAALRDLRELAETYGMDTLVEVHDAQELERAAASGARIIGVNNRDLRTFEVRLETSLRLAEKMPAGVVRVSESGIRAAADVRTLSAAGYHAFLVGEHLVKSPNPAESVRELTR